MWFKENLAYYRNDKKARVGVLIVLILIVIGLLYFWGKAKWLLLVVLVLLFAALGMQLTDWDLDLETLWKTGSVTDSRVMQKDGLKVLGSDCITNNLNCSNFTTQGEAQAKYEACSTKIASDNGVDGSKVKSVDIFGLDRDKDGVVCESLPKATVTN
jgi:hypothetical protein